ncbi:CD151 antigen-like [Mizuhopecten yessoensis]|uniref:Tetraspanin n=1 Tax=Mizuhopecten yessoensis TaxID=6573 RepID=A0A210QZK7_MIZYE|nr:CD151 antigen-like [Mizuhopecten yessoensis]XP_021345841.1 CD151 antigen-like [Mizuhopecten yessoensis]XP_021345842.1 CD151 antigen-like [Mizuhopecten yessoensis]XP_021345843.1 CD151 antigen-like [Mizuhopecten yessoensis]XP_021345845.1 CD151 antigen-like [Mizuhopecten yessoensis]OWF54198.1 Tetraspanin-11 [Mizuhopecten yessoensis]
MMNPRYPRKRKHNDLCGKNFLRFVIYVFTFLFLLSGVAFLATGLYIKLEKFTYVNLLGSSTFPIATFLLIATGAFILLSGILGCTGACVENRCCLVMYAVFLLLIFLIEAISGVLAYMYDGTIREELTRNLNKSMMEKYSFDPVFTKSVDDMQIEFKCCGAATFEDWKYSRWLKADNETLNNTPESCCKTVGVNCAISTHPSNIQYDSCSLRLEQYTKSNLVLIGGIGLGLCCIQIFGIIFSCCLVRKIKDDMMRRHF